MPTPPHLVDRLQIALIPNQCSLADLATPNAAAAPAAEPMHRSPEQDAERLRQRGNEHFGRGSYTRAADLYQRVSLLFQSACAIESLPQSDVGSRAKNCVASNCLWHGSVRLHFWLAHSCRQALLSLHQRCSAVLYQARNGRSLSRSMTWVSKYVIICCRQSSNKARREQQRAWGSCTAIWQPATCSWSTIVKPSRRARLGCRCDMTPYLKLYLSSL